MAIYQQLYANGASTTVSVAVGPTDTSIQVTSAAGFPSPGTGQFFLATLIYSGLTEIILVTGVSGNTLSGIIRAQESTSPSSFPIGATIECRVTAGTLANFARYTDRLYELATVDALSPPATSNANSYICHSNDDSGNPVVAFRNTGSLWSFVNYTLTKLSGTILVMGSYSFSSTSVGNTLNSAIPGQYILQFTSGVCIGICRMVSSASTNTVSFSTALPFTPSAGDQFEIFQSNSSVFNALISEVSNPPSDPTKISVNNGTATGLLTVNKILATNQLDVKGSTTANTSTTTLDWSLAGAYKVVIAANTTFSFINVPSGTNIFSFTIITVNNSTPGYAVAWPTNCKFAGGILPPRTTTANAMDIWTGYTDDGGVTFVLSLAIANAQ